MQNVGIYTFGYYYFDTLFDCKLTMGKGVTHKSLITVGGTTLFLMFLGFELVGIVGYVSLGSEAVNLDLLPMRPSLIGRSDILMSVAKLFLTFAVYIAALVRMVSMKNQFFKINELELTTKRNLMFVGITMFIPGIIGYVYPGVADWVSLLGSLCMTTLSVIFPTWMTLKTYSREMSRLGFWSLIIWCIVCTALGYTSAVFTLMKMVGRG